MAINLTYHEFIVYFMIFVRLATIMATIPFFGFAAVPPIAKAGLAMMLTFVMFPFIDHAGLQVSTQIWPFVISLMNQVLIGLVIGFAADFLFVGVRYAGTLIGMDMGFGIVNVIDPQSGQQVSLVGQLKFLLATLLFIVMDGHLFLLQTIKLSFEVIPVSNHFFSVGVMEHLGNMSKEIFVTGIKLGSAALASLFVTSFMMGILARTVPQMNIFIVGFPIKITIGFVMLVVSLPFFGYAFTKVYSQFQRDLVMLVQML
jgi:flagellar biosynthesis protein FliR